MMTQGYSATHQPVHCGISVPWKGLMDFSWETVGLLHEESQKNTPDQLPVEALWAAESAVDIILWKWRLCNSRALRPINKEVVQS